MIGQIFSGPVDAPIVFAGAEDKAGGSADMAGGSFSRRRRATFLEIHCTAASIGKATAGGDQLDLVAAARKPSNTELSKANPCGRAVRP